MCFPSLQVFQTELGYITWAKFINLTRKSPPEIALYFAYNTISLQYHFNKCLFHFWVLFAFFQQSVEKFYRNCHSIAWPASKTRQEILGWTLVKENYILHHHTALVPHKPTLGENIMALKERWVQTFKATHPRRNIIIFYNIKYSVYL